jgi:hypothetical protein
VKTLTTVRIAVLALVACAGITAGLFLWQPVWVFHWQDFRTGDQIVSRVEAFRTSHKRLPDALKEVGLDDPDLKVFYRKISDEEYSVWFGTSLGESETYNSGNRKWE